MPWLGEIALVRVIEPVMDEVAEQSCGLHISGLISYGTALNTHAA
jgi:hypothetical protein